MQHGNHGIDTIGTFSPRALTMQVAPAFMMLVARKFQQRFTMRIGLQNDTATIATCCSILRRILLAAEGGNAIVTFDFDYCFTNKHTLSSPEYGGMRYNWN